MNIVIVDPCSVLEPGSWLWYAAGCWLGRIITVLTCAMALSVTSAALVRMRARR